MQDTCFEDCKIVGAEFFKCEKSFLQYCNFADLNIKHASFYGCKLKECYFNDTSLIEADFRDTDLSGTIFHNSDLSKAKFSFPEAIELLRGFEIDIV